MLWELAYLALLLMEQDPLQAIERMNSLDLVQIISPQIEFTKESKDLLEGIKGVVAWYNLLFLEETYEPWKVYWYGLTSSLDTKAMEQLAERLQMFDQDSRKMISERAELNQVLEKLYRFDDASKYKLYTLLSHYGTEILLYMMAKANNEKSKRLISNYFTRLKGTKIMLQGKDLKGMGIKPGPLYKEIFDSLLKAKLDNLISTRDDEISFVKETFEMHF